MKPIWTQRRDLAVGLVDAFRVYASINRAVAVDASGNIVVALTQAGPTFLCGPRNTEPDLVAVAYPRRRRNTHLVGAD